MTNIISRDAQNFDKDRLAQSIQRVTTANRTPVGEAENFARCVVQRIERWLGDKTEVTGRELRLQTAAALADYDPDAAYFYENEKRIF
jgi:hypothetical protein